MEPSEFASKSEGPVGPLPQDPPRSLFRLQAPPIRSQTNPMSHNESKMTQQRPAFLAAMPFPGTAGALYFNGSNVTEFLEVYEDMCEDY